MVSTPAPLQQFPMLTCAVLSVLLAYATASPSLSIRDGYAVKETHPVPPSWSRVGPAPNNHLVRLQIGLKQSSLDELDRHLYEVSTPSHPRYGQHLSQSEVAELVKPSDKTSQLVAQWLADHDIAAAELQYNEAKDWITVTLPVNTIERMLDTEYSLYAHEDGTHLVRTPEWSLPEGLHDHIDVIQPTNSFFRPTQQARTVKEIIPFEGQGWTAPDPPEVGVDAQKACNVSMVTPACLRTLYGTIDYQPRAINVNKIGLNDFLGESNNRSDTKLFLEQFRPEAVDGAKDFKVVVIANGNNEQTQENATELAAGKDFEGNLDSETILGISWPTPMVAYTTGGSPPFIPDTNSPTDTNEPYLTWVNYVLSQSSLPQVISTSYGDDEQTVPKSYAEKVCNGFKQLGARGISLFFASGDAGVGKEGTCISNDGTNATTFLANFPASCPYITTVGATKNIPEVVAIDKRNGFASGGGFSRYFDRPSYQNETVAAYIKSLGSEFHGLYNPNGRGYPDIAAQGYHYATIWNGTLLPLDGTSAATPTAAAVIALVNDALIANGKPPLGFLNPWLYAGGFTAFTDITSGSAEGCGTRGFPADRGWDAVTGFGTPYFPAIVKHVLTGSGHRL